MNPGIGAITYLYIRPVLYIDTAAVGNEVI